MGRWSPVPALGRGSKVGLSGAVGSLKSVVHGCELPSLHTAEGKSSPPAFENKFRQLSSCFTAAMYLHFSMRSLQEPTSVPELQLS